jgi:C-terminal processing protease CtpA/Prc
VSCVLTDVICTGTPLTLGLRRQNGRLFYVRVQRAQPKGQFTQQPNQVQQQQQRQQAPPPQQPPKPAPGVPRQQAAPLAGSGEVVGIGIGLALDSEHNLCISSLLPGSPALRSGLVEEGDILRYVDGKDVRGMTPEQVRPMILGKTGTFVTVSVQRGNTQIVARMARARPAPGEGTYIPKAGSMAAPRADTNTYSAVYAQVTAERQTSPGQNGPRGGGGYAGYSIAPGSQPEPEQKPADQELCGIGVVLAQSAQGELLVMTMNEGGPAARSNLIKKGDVMHTIDGVDVYCQTIDQVRPLILGLPGSTVVLGFQRPGMRRPVNVRLRRGNIKTDLKNIPNPSPRPSPSATPGGGATPKQSPQHTPRQSPSQTPVSTRPSSPKLQAQQRNAAPPGMPDIRQQRQQEREEENKYGMDGPVCGLGIVLVPTPFGSLCVASITDGGPAARSGRIYRGDFVETIDGVSVKDMTINAVRPLILGRAGTSVTLGLRRESEDSVIYVRIMREPVRLGEVLVPGMRVNPVRLFPLPFPQGPFSASLFECLQDHTSTYLYWVMQVCVAESYCLTFTGRPTAATNVGAAANAAAATDAAAPTAAPDASAS